MDELLDNNSSSDDIESGSFEDLGCIPLDLRNKELSPLDQVPDNVLLNDTKGTKIRKNKGKWEKNVRKTKKSKGECYKNSAGKIIVEKRFEPVISCCKENCHNKIKTDNQKLIFEKYYALGTYDEQRAYIFSQVKIKPVARHYVQITTTPSKKPKDSTRFYYLPSEEGVDRKVCKTFFKKVLLVSDGQIDRTMKSKSNLTPPKDQRGHHTPWNKTSEDKVKELCEFINSFPSYESYYAETKRWYLGPDLNIRKMYVEYKSKVSDPISEYLFRRTFNTKFNLHFHPPLTYSGEKRVTLINNQMKSAADESQSSKLRVN